MSPSIRLILFYNRTIQATPLEDVLIISEDDEFMDSEDDIQLIIQN